MTKWLLSFLPGNMCTIASLSFCLPSTSVSPGVLAWHLAHEDEWEESQGIWQGKRASEMI